MNPKQIAMNMLKQRVGSNPMLKNVMEMANRNDTKGIEQVARNLCATKGIDADKMFEQYKNQFK